LCKEGRVPVFGRMIFLQGRVSEGSSGVNCQGFFILSFTLCLSLARSALVSLQAFSSLGLCSRQSKINKKTQVDTSNVLLNDNMQWWDTEEQICTHNLQLHPARPLVIPRHKSFSTNGAYHCELHIPPTHGPGSPSKETTRPVYIYSNPRTGTRGGARQHSRSRGWYT
jgi:hypothetical protein